MKVIVRYDPAPKQRTIDVAVKYEQPKKGGK